MRYASGFQPSQSILSAVPSVANLDPEITINSNLMTTIARYNARDATTGLWLPDGYGEILTIASTGTDPTVNNGSILYGPRDDSVYFPAGKVYQASNSDFANFTTEDLYAEFFIIHGSTFPSTIDFYAKGNVYAYVAATTGKVTFVFTGTGGYRRVTYDVNSSVNSIIFASVFLDPSESTDAHGLQLYVNNLNNSLYGGTVANPSLIGSLTNSSNFTIGSTSSFVNKYLGSLSYLLYGKGSNIYAGGAQNLVDWAAFHKHRFHSVFGIASSKLYSLGTYTRASTATVAKRLASGSVEYNQVGSGMPRPSNTPQAFIGQLNQESGTNVIYDSANLTTWTQVRCSLTSGVASPIKGEYAYGLIDTVDNDTHYATSPSNPIGDTVGQVVKCSAILAAGARDRCYWYVFMGGGTFIATTVNLTNETISSIAGPSIISSEFTPVGTFGGVFYKLVQFTALSNKAAGNATSRFYTLSAAGSPTYIGDGSTVFYVALSQVELYPATLDPYLWLKFDTGSGTALADSSGNSRNQTLVGSEAAFWVTGKDSIGYAGSFDASVPNYVSLPIAYFDGTKGTWACWVKSDWTNAPTSSARIVSTNHSGGSNYQHRNYWNTSTWSYSFSVGNGSGLYTSYIGDMRPYDNKWVHIAWTWNYPGSGNTTIKGYLNGVNITGSNGTITGPLSNPDFNFFIGRWGGSYLTGSLDDFSFFQRTLDADDIYLLYTDSPLCHRGGYTSPIITTTTAATRVADSGIMYPYSNPLGKGSKICKFWRDQLPGCKKTIWEISDGGSVNERIHAYVDENGHISIEVIVGGVSEGIVSISQNVCDKRSWILAARWTATVLDLVIYNMTTQITYTATTALTAFPTGLDENRPALPCNAVIGDCDDLDYYEADNRRLLFG